MGYQFNLNALGDINESLYKSKGYVVIDEALNGVRPESIKNPNREVHFDAYLPEHLENTSMDQLYSFIKDWLNSLYDSELDVPSLNSTTGLYDQFEQIGLFEKINRLMDKDNAFQLEFDMLQSLANEYGFDFALNKDVSESEYDEFSTEYKKSVRGFLDSLPSIVKSKGTLDACRALFLMLGFHVDFKQKYFKVDPKRTNHLNEYPEQFNRDLYLARDEIQVAEHYPILTNLSDINKSKWVQTQTYDVEVQVGEIIDENLDQHLKMMQHNIDFIRPATAVFSLDDVSIDCGYGLVAEGEDNVSGIDLYELFVSAKSRDDFDIGDEGVNTTYLVNQNLNTEDKSLNYMLCVDNATIDQINTTC